MDDTPARMNRREEFAGHSAEEITGRESSPSPDVAAGMAAPTSASQVSPSPSAHDSDRRTREIRAEIEQTREEMSETIEAIQERIRPRTLVADAAEHVRHTAKEKVTSMAHMAGRHAQDMMQRAEGSGGGQQAIPIALIGLGTAWMLLSRGRSERRHAAHASGSAARSREGDAGAWGQGTTYMSRTDLEKYGGYGDTEIYGGGGYREYSRDRGWDSSLLRRIARNPVPAALAGAGLAWLAFSGGSDEEEWYDSEDLYRGSMGSYADTQPPNSESGVGHMATQAMDSARDVVSRAQEGTRELAHRAQDYIGGTRNRMGRRRRGVQREVQHLMDTNPLLMGAGAFMLGAAVGLVVPESEREHEWMGETRDRMFERAQERARDVAKSTAAEVKHAASDAVGRLASDVVGPGDQQKTGGTGERTRA
jgi:hypothetical protein